MRIKWKVEAKACISAAAQQSVSLYNNCARVTILDTAVVKIVCCTQEGLLRARSELHPDDTATASGHKIGHLQDARGRKKEPRTFAITSDCLDKKSSPGQATY